MRIFEITYELGKNELLPESELNKIDKSKNIISITYIGNMDNIYLNDNKNNKKQLNG